MFEFATSKTHFLFNGDVYDQVDGVAMGSPLGPALANLFMGHYEDEWLKSAQGSKIKFYRRYVDDIFCILDSETDGDQFLSFLNQQHQNIKFTMEKEMHKKLPFLDIECEIEGETFITKVYHKSTYTGLLMNFFSFASRSYKNSLLRTLIDRIFRINNTWKGFHHDIGKLKYTLQKNEYPIKLINSYIYKYLDNTYKNDISNIEKEDTPDKNIKYFKLPYIGTMSTYTQKKINDLIKRCCKPNLNIQLVFNSCKLSSFFSIKDKVPKELQSFVVYKFLCSGCNATYIGMTCSHLITRIKQHLVTDKNSHVLKHLNQNEDCKACCDATCFSIIDKATTKYDLLVKEGIHIQLNKPSLNGQLQSYKLSILI